MSYFYEIARKAQFVDQLVPLRWRVPFRFACQKLVGGLEPEMALLPDLVDPNKLSIDVGGNRGVYTYALARLCRKIAVFEPIPECANLIEAWAGAGKVEVCCCALGATEGSFVLHLPRLNGAVVTTRASLVRVTDDCVDIPVPVRTLDSFKFENVGFIKIDVEGFELEMLRGAVHTLQTNRPNLLIEIDPKVQSHERFGATFHWLEALGYQAYFLTDQGLSACGASIQTLQPSVYNFVFLPVSIA